MNVTTRKPKMIRRSRETIRISRKTIESLDFRLCPSSAGHVVEVAYACDDSGLYCRCHDHSDRTTTYHFASYQAEAAEAQLAFEPQNSKFNRLNSWRDVVVG